MWVKLIIVWVKLKIAWVELRNVWVELKIAWVELTNLLFKMTCVGQTLVRSVDIARQAKQEIREDMHPFVR